MVHRSDILKCIFSCQHSTLSARRCGCVDEVLSTRSTSCQHMGLTPCGSGGCGVQHFGGSAYDDASAGRHTPEARCWLVGPVRGGGPFRGDACLQNSVYVSVVCASAYTTIWR